MSKEVRARGENKRKLKVRVKEHRTETEKVSNGARYTLDRKRQSQTKMWGSVITDHITEENHLIQLIMVKIYISTLLSFHGDLSS